jgi:hypothetical protein
MSLTEKIGNIQKKSILAFHIAPHIRELPLSQALNYELKTPRWAHANLK